MNLERQYGLEVYPKRDINIVRGDGALVWDDKGNEYIDCVGGIGVANIGHANPYVSEAIKNQSETLLSCPGIFYNNVRGELMEKLISVSPSSLEKVFLCNSGTEANEAAIKFARISTGKNGFISVMRGFHGRTMGALSATFKYRDEFEPLIPGNSFVPLNNIQKLEQAINENTAAIIIEIIQGEGGVRAADQNYLRSVRQLCDEKNILLVVDEIQTGFGRTGKMFACEHSGITPDMMTLAKAMAGGVPMGAVLCSTKVSSALSKHGSTFGGNPLACAASLATIKYIEDYDLVNRSCQAGKIFSSLVKDKLPDSVREFRQFGLMIGIELKTKSRPIIEKLLELGVLALPAGPTVVRLLPPLVISEEQLSCLSQKIMQALK